MESTSFQSLYSMTSHRNSRIHVFCFAIGLLATSCGQAPKKGAEKVPEKVSPDRLSEAVPRDRYADDVGRFLAGMPARAGSPLVDLQKQAAWTEHCRELDQAWAGIETATLPAMREFQKQDLSARPITGSPVFYPFSGPDALMVTVLFPENSAYVMVGLEPAGTLPSPKQLGRKNLGKYLAGVRATVDSELSRSFFITRQMDRQLRGQIDDGVVLPMLELLVRSNHTILGFRYVRLDDDGQIIERAASYKAPGKIGNKGVEIDFQRDDDHSVHKLLYFSVNLSDERLRQDQPFLTFLAGLKPAATLLKATSYMIHKNEFSMIRDRVLAKSVAVLQDDSGIPYHFLAAPPWHVQLYGAYDQPYGSFKWLGQTDLRKAYQTQNPKPLGFRVGYGYGRVPSNLLLATRAE